MLTLVMPVEATINPAKVNGYKVAAEVPLLSVRPQSHAEPCLAVLFRRVRSSQYYLGLHPS